MKKVHLLFALLLVLCSNIVCSQNRALYINESFDSLDFPEGWEILSWNSDNWSISNTNQAGGQPNEISMMWLPSLTGITGRLGSPLINLSDHSGTLLLEFQYIVQNIGECVLGVATTSDNGATWNVVYEEDSPQFPTPIEYVSIEIDNSDVGSENFRFCFFFHSDEGGMATKRWLIDNVLLYSSVDYDAQLVSIDGIAEAVQQGRNEVGFTFTNKGEQTIAAIEVSYQFGGVPIITENFIGLSVATGETHSLTFPEKTLLELHEDYELTVTIERINGEPDQELENNTLTMNVHAYAALSEKRVVIDHFTSSTCAPCPAANQEMSEFLNNNPDKAVITKYQMNWPGTGDPYYNADGGLRKTFYNVAGVPKIFFNGYELSTYNFEEWYKYYALKQAPIVEIRGVFNIDQTTINVDFDIAAYEALNDVTVFVAVNEKHTVGNVGNNGETDFYHVMMKMLPNGNGSLANFDQNEVKHFSFEYDLSNTFVEEYDDLEVSVFVQNSQTKEIYNGNYLKESQHVFNLPPTDLSLIKLSSSSFRATWEHSASMDVIGYNVYLNDELVVSNAWLSQYTFEVEESDNIYIVKVAATYPEETESVRIADYIRLDNVGLEQQTQQNKTHVYPNPAKDYVQIKADNNIIKKVGVYNLVGQIVKT